LSCAVITAREWNSAFSPDIRHWRTALGQWDVTRMRGEILRIWIDGPCVGAREHEQFRSLIGN
jgi:hypothetical protein